MALCGVLLGSKFATLNLVLAYVHLVCRFFCVHSFIHTLATLGEFSHRRLFEEVRKRGQECVCVWQEDRNAGEDRNASGQERTYTYQQMRVCMLVCASSLCVCVMSQISQCKRLTVPLPV